MRALVYTAPGKMMLEDRPRPRTASGEIEVVVDAAGICGLDISSFLGRSRRCRSPLILGHELVGHTPDGRRVAANPLVSCGRCAACLTGAQNLCPKLCLLGLDRSQGCFAEYVAVPESHVYEIPADLPDARAILAEPLANIVHFFRLAAPLPFFRMGIVGAGTMGSLALETALHLGARQVLVEDVDDAHLETARRMGATLALNSSATESRADAAAFTGEGLDLVLDASGAEAARQRAFDLCRPGGTVVLLGMAAGHSQLDFNSSIRREHRVVMSFGYTPVDFERSLSLLIDGRVDLTPWTMELPLEEGQRAFEEIAASRGATLKTFLRVRPGVC